jgi:hypothetical protein
MHGHAGSESGEKESGGRGRGAWRRNEAGAATEGEHDSVKSGTRLGPLRAGLRTSRTRTARDNLSVFQIG